MQLVSVLCIPVRTIPTCSLFLCFNLFAEQHPYITFFFLKFLSLFLSFFCDMYIVQAQLHRQSCMINNRVYYVELLVDSNCVSSFLEKRGCSHAQLILVIESRRRMN